MKKLILFFVFVFAGLVTFSQDLRFTKGDIAPGKFQGGRDFETFLHGKIKVTDAAGTAYNFVKAEFTVNSKEGNVQINLTSPSFSGSQMAEVLKYGRDGATYTFNKIVVKDHAGKEITIAAVEFIYDPHQR